MNLFSKTLPIYKRVSFYLILCVIGGFFWVSITLQRSEIQSIECEKLLNEGGQYWYDFQLDKNGNERAAPEKKTRPVLEKLFGKDFLHSVHKVQFIKGNNNSKVDLLAFPALRYAINLTENQEKEQLTLKYLKEVKFHKYEVASTFSLRNHRKLKHLELHHGIPAKLDWAGYLPHLISLKADIEDESELKVLSDHSKLETLSLTVHNPVDLSTLNGIPNLRNLSLYSTHTFPDLDLLENHPTLERIDLDGMLFAKSPTRKLTKVKSLRCGFATINLNILNKLPNLEALDLTFCQPYNLQGVSNLEHLKTLLLPKEFEPNFSLAKLRKIEKLYLGDLQSLDLTQLPDPNCLKEISIGNSKGGLFPNLDQDSQLEQLWLVNCRNMKGLPGVLPKLSTVHLLNSSVDTIPASPDLRELRLFSSNAESYTTLRQAHNLSVLWADDAMISNIDFLENAHCLRELSISKNPVSDLTPLKDAANLEILMLDDTQVSDLRPLSKHKNLKKLKLSGSKFHSMKQLLQFPELESIELNRLENIDLSLLNKIPSLKNLSIVESNFGNLEALADHKNLNSISISPSAIKKINLDKFSQQQKSPHFIIKFRDKSLDTIQKYFLAKVWLVLGAIPSDHPSYLSSHSYRFSVEKLTDKLSKKYPSLQFETSVISEDE